MAMKPAMTRTVALLLAFVAGLLLGGCGRPAAAPAASDTPAKPGRARGPLTEADTAQVGGTPIEKIPFHTGVSSATVEKLAKAQGCTGGPGAGLITEPGPVEVYRMQCDSGKVFMARCELRQCRPL
jgi:hypothetical protein